MAPSIRNRTWALSLLCSIAVAAVVLSLAGDLEPPGSPSPTMENLIRNDDLPLTITAPGSYALAEDLSTAGGGITVSASNVSIDLRGHVLEGGSGDGIGVTVAGLRNIVVKNGTVRGWGGDGVDLLTSTPAGSQILHVLAEGNLGDGIRATTGSLVSGCTSNANTGDGIEGGGSGGSIVESTASSNGGHGINAPAGAWNVTACSAVVNTGAGINAPGTGSGVYHCTVRDNNGDGIVGGSAGVVVGCVAYSNGDSAGDDGIVANSGTTIVNCTSNQNWEDGIEVFAGNIVRGNSARSNSGNGINVTFSSNRIEENDAALNTLDGINVNPASGNFVIRNSSSANGGLEYDFAGGNSYGLVTAGAAGFSNSNSWANYTY